MVRLIVCLFPWLFLQGPKAEQKHKASQALPIIYNDRLKHETLTEHQIELLSARADEYCPTGRSVWFAWIRTARRVRKEVEVACVVYYSPEFSSRRLRKGNCVAISDRLPIEKEIHKRVRGRTTSQPTKEQLRMLRDYCQVSLPDQPFGVSLDCPTVQLLPFGLPTGFSYKEIIEVVDIVRRNTPLDHEAMTFGSAGMPQKIDGSLPILRVRRERDSTIEIETGIIDAPLSGSGQSVSLNRVAKGYRVMSIYEWVS